MYRATISLLRHDFLKDYHNVLGVPRDASKEEIRSAYIKKAKLYHPDANKSSDAEIKFKSISEAYEILKDDERRAIAESFRSPRSSYARAASADAATEALRRERHKSMIRGLNWFELLIHPRTLMTLIPTLALLSFLLSDSAEIKRVDAVPAWFNPQSRRWETPAPWNPEYRTLNPEIKRVERSLVFESSR